jgi:NADH-quinone oxidoreductase subunit A
LFLYNYFSLFFLLLFSTIIIFLLLFLTYFLTPQYPYYEKLSAYECGFQPFGFIREQQDIHFYKIAIAYLIFDIEIIFLNAWALNLSTITCVGYYTMLIFLFLLILGFFYEYIIGTLML